MKFFFSTEKYLFEIAGQGSICFDGYRTPYHVYRRKIPFVYSFIGTCWLAHWDKAEDIKKWVKEKERERRRK